MRNFIGSIFPSIIEMEERLSEKYRPTFREIYLQAYFQSEQVRLYFKYKKDYDFLTSLVIIHFPPFRDISVVLTFDDGERMEKVLDFEDMTFDYMFEGYISDMIDKYQLKKILEQESEKSMEETK